MVVASARRILVLSLFALCALGAPRPGHARGTSDAKKAAMHLLGVGASKYKSHDYKAALEAFQQAYATYPSSKILFNIAQVYKALGQSDLAADAFTEFLQKSAADVKLDERRIKEARGALRELGPQIIHVKVDVSPSTAELTLDDGRKVGSGFYLKHASDDDLVAKHHLSAKAPGFTPAETEFTLASVQVLNKGGKGLALTLAAEPTTQKTTVIERTGDATLIPVPMPAKPPPATTEPVVLAPTTTPATPAPSPAQPAAPNVTPTAAELAQLQTSRTPAADAMITTSRPHGRHTASFIAWGIGGAFAASAIVVGSIALAQNGQTGAHSKAQIADALWGCTAAAAITGGVLWFAAPGDAGSGGEVGVAGRF